MNGVRARIPRWLKLAYAVLVAAVLGWVLLQAGPELLHWRSLLATPWAYVFIASWVAMAVMLGGLWALLLRWAYGVRLGLREWLPVQALAWGGRYLPGKIGLLAGKAALAERDGLGWRRLGYSVLFEQLAFVVSGFVIALLLLSSPEMVPAAWRPDWLLESWTAFRLAGALVGAGGFVLGLAWVGRRTGTDAGLSASGGAVLLSLYLAPHVVVGLGAWALLTAMVPGAAALGVMTVIGIVALAHVSGVLAVFAPAGLGVRELVLAAGLSSVLPLSEAVAFATLLRLLSLVADGLFLLIGLSMKKPTQAGGSASSGVAGA